MIYFDVSNLLYWNKDHFTGIERATAGLLKGMIGLNSNIQLVAFAKSKEGFFIIDHASLPKVVRTFIGNAQGLSRTGKEIQDYSLKHQSDVNKKQTIREILKSFLPKTLLKLIKEIRAFSQKIIVKVTETRKSVVFCKGDIFLSIGCDWDNRERDKVLLKMKSEGVVNCQMIHDLIPIGFKQWVHQATSDIVSDWMFNAINSTSILLANSEFTKSEILRFFRNQVKDSNSILAIRLGDELALDNIQYKEPSYIPEKPFFLFVSSLDPRKNHRLLYNAWKVLHRDYQSHLPELICIGSPQFLYDDLMYEILNDTSLKAHIKFLSNINDFELNWYYKNCQATLYPSYFEGWGLPVAESLARGKACMASNIPTVKEISNDLVILFDPLDPKQLASLVLKAVLEPSWISEYENRIRNNFLPTTWKQSAANLLKGIENLLSSKQP